MKVVVLGGYGNFGARISRALAGDAAVDLVVAGRDLARARAFAVPLGAGAAALDTTHAGLADQLASLGAQLVIHTAGPFQGQDYAVARAAVAAACHYIDLADGRRFVCDFAPALDRLFRHAKRSAVTGASTVPALSSAVVDALRPRFARLDAIDFCIAPAQQAPRGPATIAGVLSYCGAPGMSGRTAAGSSCAVGPIRSPCASHGSSRVEARYATSPTWSSSRRAIPGCGTSCSGLRSNSAPRRRRSRRSPH
jgi:hypothetical protein